MTKNLAKNWPSASGSGFFSTVSTVFKAFLSKLATSLSDVECANSTCITENKNWWKVARLYRKIFRQLTRFYSSWFTAPSSTNESSRLLVQNRICFMKQKYKISSIQLHYRRNASKFSWVKNQTCHFETALSPAQQFQVLDWKRLHKKWDKVVLRWSWP